MDKAAIDVAKALTRLSELTIFELRGEWRPLRAATARERAEVEEAERVRADPVRQMLARAKAARPEPSPAEDRSRWKRIFAGAPSKAVWK